MSLALVKLREDEFEFILEHLRARQPRYQNMHLRKRCQRDGEPDLRYLHAIHANEGERPEIEGMISGPGIVWHYKMSAGKTGTQLQVMVDRASPKERARIGERFVPEIMRRIQDDQRQIEFAPNYSAGQYYLRRNVRGMAATHPTCRRAVAAGVLSPLFVAKLAAWKLELLCP